LLNRFQRSLTKYASVTSVLRLLICNDLLIFAAENFVNLQL
jgi:hypothetical protein